MDGVHLRLDGAYLQQTMSTEFQYLNTTFFVENKHGANLREYQVFR